MRPLCLFFLLLCSAMVPVDSKEITLDEFVDPTGMLQAQISPDAKRIAAIVFNGNNHGIVLIDTTTHETTLIGEGRFVNKGNWGYHKSPRRVTWAGNDALAVDYGLDADAIDLHGKQLARLGESIIGVIDTGKDAGKLIVNKGSDAGIVSVCDPRGLACSRFYRPPGKPIKWAFDRQGRLRAISVINSAVFSDVSTITHWYLPDGQPRWVKLKEFKITDDYWLPMYVPDEPDTLVINSRIGRDTYALFNYDVKQGRQTEMLAGHPTQDITSWRGIDEEAFNYVSTQGMLPQQVWFDPTWARMQAQVDLLLPKRINVISGDPERKMFIHSRSDIDPGSWYLLDLAEKKLTEIGRVKPELASAQLQPMEIISYKAADGLTIPAYLTRPKERQAAAPLVVLIHGGPVARDHWGFDADVQVLASRGYAVFQPQFRGSSGFGRAFEHAGYRQWGRAMQDDITAGVHHLIREGIADGKRICIVGASYGGYAALWGLIKTPELYKCGVSFAGVTDIAHMFSDWSDSSFDKVSRQVMAFRIGDRGDRAELFDPVSPLRHADRIVAPVLLMHGEDDERVPISHGKKMLRALQERNKQVTWLTFEEEGHGLHYIKNQYQYYVTLLDFLEKHLGPANGERQAGSAQP